MSKQHYLPYFSRNVHKVVDLGLEDLIGRTNDDDFTATRLTSFSFPSTLIRVKWLNE